MTVRIVTDSVSDLPKEVVEGLGIIIVPLYVQFGTESYRDRTEITSAELYKRMPKNLKDPNFPTTSAGPPGDFLQVYQKLLAEGADKIISIHLSSKLSAVHEVATQAKEMMDKDSHKIEIIDSATALMAQGLLAMSAARLAQESKDSEEIITSIKESIPRIHFLAIIDTVEYLDKGGRAIKALSKIKIAPVLLKLFKPFLTIKEGEAHFGGIVQSHNRKKKLLEFIEKFPNMKEIALEYSPGLEGETEKMIEQLNKEVAERFPGIPVYVSLVSPVIGTHVGPGALAVSLIE